jgi:hypothetical protein
VVLLDTSATALCGITGIMMYNEDAGLDIFREATRVLGTLPKGGSDLIKMRQP